MKFISDILRNLFIQFRRFKLASSLNLVGLCIALTTFFLFFTKVEEDVRYNTCFKDWKNMYRIELHGKIFGEESDSLASIFAPMRNIAKDIPHVKDIGILESSCRTFIINRDGKNNKKHNIYSGIYFDGYAEYLSFFGVEMIDSIQHKDGDIIVPESYAKNTYGTVHICGKNATWNNSGHEEKHRIAGVYRDFPNNCSVMNGFYQYGNNKDSDYYHNFMYQIFVRLDDTNNQKAVENEILRKIKGLYKEYSLFVTDISSIKVKLRPLHSTYFSKVDEKVDKGNWVMIIILFFSALLIIVLANANFINFTMAMAPMRIKNINICRVFGASRYNIIAKLIAESVLLTTIAYMISMIFLFVLNEFLVGDISPLHHERITLYTFCISLWTGVMSSVYPAFFSTSFTPDIAIKGTFGITATSRRFRTIRIAFQLVVCLVATSVISSLLIQQYFIFSSEQGFDKNNIIYGTIRAEKARIHKEDICRELEKVEGVKSVSFSRFEIGTDDRYFKWSLRTFDNKYSIFAHVLPIDRKYIKTLGIKIIEGRDICDADSAGFIVNKAAKELFPWIKPGKYLLPYDNISPINHKVIGICDNIIFSSIRMDYEKNPLIFYIPEKGDKDYYEELNTINIQIRNNNDTQNIKDKIISIYSKYSGQKNISDELNLRCVQDSFFSLYYEEFQFLLNMIMVATIFIITTLIGVFCVTLFECEYKKKEIAIRKVFGSTTVQVIVIFIKKFLLIIMCSMLISIPLSYTLIDILMSRFTLHSHFVNLAYPISIGVVTIAVLGTVCIQSYRAANQKPTDNNR